MLLKWETSSFSGLIFSNRALYHLRAVGALGENGHGSKGSTIVTLPVVVVVTVEPLWRVLQRNSLLKIPPKAHLGPAAEMFRLVQHCLWLLLSWAKRKSRFSACRRHSAMFPVSAEGKYFTSLSLRWLRGKFATSDSLLSKHVTYRVVLLGGSARAQSTLNLTDTFEFVHNL